MRSRECLGNTSSKYNQNAQDFMLDEIELTLDVIYKASTTSRLTNGLFTDDPISHISVTYLYNTNTKDFSRGYNAIESNALYLPSVFMENTYEDGKWIKSSDIEWITDSTKFKLKETINKLTQKAKTYNYNFNNDSYKLYETKTVHYTINDYYNI